MNEITRIHIAKVPFDIEIDAKHEIEKYFKGLENYARDDELMSDIEIRVTELLAIRGVNANGVITSKDVDSIKNQLGEPSDFKTEESIENFEREKDVIPKKKLYRDKEGGILGGVLSGFANYFAVDPIWIRLGFVALFIASAGSLALLYVLFWLIIPPARTAIEKIQMTGRNVNLDTIREFNENEIEQEFRYQRADAARRVIGVLFGCMFLAMSVSALMVTVLASIKISTEGLLLSGGFQMSSGWAMLAAFVLSVIAGLLLSLLFAICSYACFFRKLSKKIGISIASIIALGVVTFGSAAGIAMMNPSDHMIDQFEKINITIPNDFSKITSLESDVSSASVRYIVSSSSKITFQTLNDEKRPQIAINGQKATIKFSDSDAANNWLNTQSVLTIYGPKLDFLQVDNGVFGYSANQQDLSVDIKGESSVLNLEKGTFDLLTIRATDSGTVNATSATVNDADINQKLSSSVLLGHVKSLIITQPQACPSEATTTTEVNGVFMKKISYNGLDIGVESRDIECGSLIVN